MAIDSYGMKQAVNFLNILPLLQSFSQDFQSQNFYATNGLFLCRSIGHHSRNNRNFRNPSAICFLFPLHIPHNFSRLFQSLHLILRPQMSISSQHLKRLVVDNRSDPHRIKSLLKKATDGLVAEIVEGETRK